MKNERGFSPTLSIQVRSKREKIHAHLFVDDLGKPNVQRIDLGAAELCRTGLVAGHGSAIAQDIDIGKAHMAGHGAHLAAIPVEVEDVAGLVAMVAAACAQLVYAANANTRALAAWRAERLTFARGLGAALAGATHGRSRPSKPR